MKRFKYILFIVFSFVLFNSSVNAAASKFEITINMQPDITENQVNVLIGFRGEEVMAVSHNLSYDSSKLTLIDVMALDNFTVTMGREVTDGTWKTIPILADSDYSFDDINFAVAVFEVKESFKVNKQADVFFYNVEAAGPDKSKYRSTGELMTMNRDSLSEMYFVTEEINDYTKIKYWIIDHIILISLIVIGIIGIILIILLLPTRRKKEHRDSAINNQIKKENYNATSAIKIDHALLDNIGKEEKVVDMTDAIIVDENVKPFGEIISRSETFIEQNVQNLEVVNTLNQNSQVIDAFNTKPDVENTNIDNGFYELSDEPTQNSEVSKDELILFQPQSFESIDNNLNVENSNSNNNGTNLFSILILVLVSISFLGLNIVKADEYRLSDLRDCIVGNISYDKDLDYSGDGKVDVLDLIYTKDLTNTEYVEEEKQDPGFKDINGQSENLISSADNN